MRKLYAISFVFLYLLAMLRPLEPFVEYYLNQDYIANFLCVNRNKPEMKCHGKCYLAKQLEKQKKSGPESSLNIFRERYPIGFVTILKINPILKFIQLKKHNFHYIKLYAYTYSPTIFHPPR